MKTEVKKVDSITREMTVEITGDRVKNKFEDVFKDVAREAKVPGFRQGHAPRDLIEKKFSGVVHERVLKELISDVYSEAVSREGLDVVELPEISDVKLDRSLLAFKAKVSVSPEIAVRNYKGIAIKYTLPAAGEDDVKRSLDSLKEQRKFEVIDDSTARGLGYPDLAAFKKAIERQIISQKESQERSRVEQEVLDAVMKGLDFKVPDSMIHRQLHDLVRQTKMDLAMRGMSREKIAQEEGKLEKELHPQAEKQVRVYLVLAEVARKENIKLDDQMPQRVMEFLLREAQWNVA